MIRFLFYVCPTDTGKSIWLDQAQYFRFVLTSISTIRWGSRDTAEMQLRHNNVYGQDSGTMASYQQTPVQEE